MLRIAIVESSAAQRAQLCHYINRCLAGQGGAAVACYDNGETFLDEAPAGLDLVLLATSLPGITGLQTAQRLRRFDSRVAIVFTTGSLQQALQGYQVNAAGVLVQPVAYADFCHHMGGVLARVQRHTSFLEVRYAKRTAFLSVDEIHYAETQGKKVVLHTALGPFTTSQTMQQLEERLTPHGFFRCHAAYLVNVHYMRALNECEVRINGESIPVSKHRRRAFAQAVSHLMQQSV